MELWHLLWIIPLSMVVGAITLACISCIAVIKLSETMTELEEYDAGGYQLWQCMKLLLCFEQLRSTLAR